MPSAKTEASELSVAFGILRLDPTTAYTQDDINRFFALSLTPEKYAKYRVEYQRNLQLYRRLYNVGCRIGMAGKPFHQANTVEWTGPHQQAATTSFAKDLLVANTPISVKTESNVVANLSPANMMVNLPGGMAPSSREENWFLSTQPDEYQDLYVFLQAMRLELQDLSLDVRTFEKQASRSDRERIQKILKEGSPEEKSEFTRRYRKLCHAVAEKSAAIFNENLYTSLASRARRAVLENLSRWFFRLDAVPYILCGIDHKEEFSLTVPDLTSWFREWDLVDMVASPDLKRGQSVVVFEVICRKKDDRSEHRIAYHAEIRWSHGRFSGSPESKLYKEFAWRDLPFLQEC